MTKNQIAYQQQIETKRSNLANEVERKRNNQAIEALRGQELAEAIRANQAREAENYRSNTTREAETARANRASEALGWGKLDEESRWHDIQQEVSYAQMDSNERIQYSLEEGRNARHTVDADINRAKNYNSIGSGIYAALTDPNLKSGTSAFGNLTKAVNAPSSASGGTKGAISNGPKSKEAQSSSKQSGKTGQQSSSTSKRQATNQGKQHQGSTAAERRLRR